MKGSPEHPPAYRPADYVRGYSGDLILDHVGECLELYAAAEEAYERDHDAAGIPDSIAPTVFATIQTMVSAVEPSPEKLRELQTRAQLATPNGAGVGS